MANEIKAQLKIANPVESQASWEAIGTTPNELFQAMTRVFSISITGLEFVDSVSIGSSQPEGVNEGKPWFKNDSLYAVGVPLAGNAYGMLYPFPPNIPLLWVRGDDEKPSYLRKLSPTELSNFDLTTPTNPEYYYVILEP